MKIKLENATADLDYKPNWADLTTGQKIRYIWDYFKLPIAIGLAVVFIIIYLIVRYVTRTNEVLFVGTTNLEISDELAAFLSEGYVDNPAFGARDRVSLYDLGAYSGDENSPNYAASTMTRIKIMAYVAADQLDVVLMDQDAFDSFSAEGYLLDLRELTKQLPEEGREDFLEDFSARFVENTVYVTDESATEGAPGENAASIPEKQAVGINLKDTAFPYAGDYTRPVYIGILSNCPRQEKAVSYLRYVMGARS